VRDFCVRMQHHIADRRSRRLDAMDGVGPRLPAEPVTCTERLFPPPAACRRALPGRRSVRACPRLTGILEHSSGHPACHGAITLAGGRRRSRRGPPHPDRGRSVAVRSLRRSLERRLSSRALAPARGLPLRSRRTHPAHVSAFDVQSRQNHRPVACSPPRRQVLLTLYTGP